MADIVSYEFDINYLDIDVTGKSVSAMVIDGKIPGPTIQANLNDRLKITFNNLMGRRYLHSLAWRFSCRMIRMECLI